MKVEWFIFILYPWFTSGFVLHPRASVTFPIRSTADILLHMADVSITTPSSDAAADMGIREWPQQAKQGSWEENSSEGQTLVRYVLDGKGTLEISTTDEKVQKQTTNLAPGTLVEVSGDALLSWTADGEIIVLTPGFEEGGKLIAVALATFALFGALIAGFGS